MRFLCICISLREEGSWESGAFIFLFASFLLCYYSFPCGMRTSNPNRCLSWLLSSCLISIVPCCVKSVFILYFTFSLYCMQLCRISCFFPLRVSHGCSVLRFAHCCRLFSPVYLQSLVRCCVCPGLLLFDVNVALLPFSVSMSVVSVSYIFRINVFWIVCVPVDSMLGLRFVATVKLKCSSLPSSCFAFSRVCRAYVNLDRIVAFRISVRISL